MSNPKKAWGLLVAATVALTGLTACQSPAQSPTASQQAVTADETSAAIAAAMIDERDMGDLDYMVEAARHYTVAAAPEGRGPSAETQERNADRLAAVKDAVAERLAGKADVAKKLKEAHDAAPETTDEEGNKSRNFAFEVERTTGQGDNARTRTRAVESTVTVDRNGTVVYSKYKASQSVSGNGSESSRVMERTRRLLNDGSKEITFHRELTFKDGRVFTTDWTKTIGADGGVTGSGQITRQRPGAATATVELTFGGTEDEPQANGKNDEAEVTLPPNGKAYGKGGKPVATEED